MSEDYCCPQCGSIKSWHFSEGESASSSWDRFDKVSPDTGNCWKCGFGYSEHVNHPLKEQVEKFRKDRRLKKENQNETKKKLIHKG